MSGDAGSDRSGCTADRAEAAGAPAPRPRARTVEPAAIARLDRCAFGLAIGAVLGLSLFVLAAFHAALVLRSEDALFVWLLGRQLLPGYEPTMGGALAGLLWGLSLGFALGWTSAAMRDLLLGAWLHVVVRRERLRADSRVLDDLS